MESDRDRRIRQERLRKIRRRRRMIVTGMGIVIIVETICLIVLLVELIGSNSSAETASITGIIAEEDAQEALIQGIPQSLYYEHPNWTEDFLTPNEYSRPGDALEEVNNIFVHYTANKDTSAAQNRSYFEQLGETGERSASAHFIIGTEGEIIQCIPLDEIAYAVKTRNFDSMSIECCYNSDDGSFTQETYDSLINLLGWLIKTYDLDADDILRHYDCGGKECPLYYVEHPDAWENLKTDVKSQK